MHGRPTLALPLLGLAALVAPAAPAPGQDGPIGFAPGSRAAQAKAEAHALGVPTPDAARAWLRSITEEPHVAGTLADYKTAARRPRQAPVLGLGKRILPNMKCSSTIPSGPQARKFSCEIVLARSLGN